MNETIQGFINAITSYGGDDYDLFEAYYTPQNEIRFQAWLKGQPKVDGVTLYRGYTFDRRYFEDADMKLGGYIGIDQLTQANLPSFTTDLFRASMYVNEYGEIGLDELGIEPIEVQQYGNITTPSSDVLTYRYDRRLPTFVTTNLAQDKRDGETLRDRYGDRLADRFNEMFYVIGFYNQSYR